MTYNSLYVAYFHKYDWLCHLTTFFRYKGGQVTKPIILVKICYKLLYVIRGVENKVTNLLASADMRVFCRTCLLTMLLLIGLALFNCILVRWFMYKQTQYTYRYFHTALYCKNIRLHVLTFHIRLVRSTMHKH